MDTQSFRKPLFKGESRQLFGLRAVQDAAGFSQTGIIATSVANWQNGWVYSLDASLAILLLHFYVRFNTQHALMQQKRVT